jgi:segregation and condensation protein A
MFRRMTEEFQLSLPGFDGAVGELTGLVSTKQIELDSIRIAQIPTQYLEAAGKSEMKLDLDVAGEVLAATARLMLMKSAHLLAQPEEEAEEAPLPRERREPLAGLRETALALGTRQGAIAYPSVGRVESVQRLTGSRPVSGLADAWHSMLKHENENAARAAVPAFVRLEVAISRILSGIRGKIRVSFQRLLHRATREEVVMHFLATLELARRGEATVEQDDLFGEISVGRVDDSHERASRAG